MVPKKRSLPRACIDMPLEDIYSVMMDIERRIHAVRTFIGKLDPNIRLKPVEDGVAAGWKPARARALGKRVVCTVCHPVKVWPPEWE